MIQASGAFTHLIIARTDSTDQTHDTRCACPLPLGAVAKAAKLIIFYQASELSQHTVLEPLHIIYSSHSKTEKLKSDK